MHPDGCAHGESVQWETRQDLYIFQPYIACQNMQLKLSVLKDLFTRLGKRFICGGDYNSKHKLWSSRISTTIGRELQKIVCNIKLEFVSTEEPNYWPFLSKILSKVPIQKSSWV